MSTNTISTLKVCFDALKTSKELKKRDIMKTALTSDMDVALKTFTSFNNAHS